MQHSGWGMPVLLMQSAFLRPGNLSRDPENSNSQSYPGSARFELVSKHELAN